MEFQAWLAWQHLTKLDNMPLSLGGQNDGKTMIWQSKNNIIIHEMKDFTATNEQLCLTLGLFFSLVSNVGQNHAWNFSLWLWLCLERFYDPLIFLMILEFQVYNLMDTRAHNFLFKMKLKAHNLLSSRFFFITGFFVEFSDRYFTFW